MTPVAYWDFETWSHKVTLIESSDPPVILLPSPEQLEALNVKLDAIIDALGTLGRNPTPSPRNRGLHT
jgi:hypothetical protein